MCPLAKRSMVRFPQEWNTFQLVLIPSVRISAAVHFGGVSVVVVVVIVVVFIQKFLVLLYM